MAIRSKKYTDGAKGQECTLQIAGVPWHDPETVVFCHFPDDSHGMALKADDTCGGDGCQLCHQIIDNPGMDPEFEKHRDWYLRRAMTRTIRNRIERGILKL